MEAKKVKAKEQKKSNLKLVKEEQDTEVLKNSEVDAILAAEAKEEEEEQEDPHFTRFKNYMEKDIAGVAMLTKDWIHSNSDKKINALKAVAQQLLPEEIQNIYLKLTPKERKNWSAIYEVKLPKDEITEINKFIYNEVSRGILQSETGEGSELYDIIMNIETSKLAAFLEQNGDLAGILLNVLPKDKLSELLADMDMEATQKYLAESVSTVLDKDNINNLKDTIAEYAKEVEEPQFHHSFLASLSNFTGEKETLAYKALSQKMGPKELAKIASEALPSDLIWKLPDSLFQSIIKEIDKDEIPYYVVAFDEEGDRVLSLYAEEGTAIRELIDMKLEEITANAEEEQKVKNRFQKYLVDFVNHFRQEFKKKPQLKDEIGEIVKEWIEELA